MNWDLIILYTVFTISAVGLIGIFGYVLLMCYCAMNSDLIERHRLIREYHRRLKKN